MHNKNGIETRHYFKKRDKYFGTIFSEMKYLRSFFRYKNSINDVGRLISQY